MLLLFLCVLRVETKTEGSTCLNKKTRNLTKAYWQA